MASRERAPNRAGQPSWLAPALDYAASWLAYQMRVSEQPGCAVAVAWRGRLGLDPAVGPADLAAGEMLTRATAFASPPTPSRLPPPRS